MVKLRAFGSFCQTILWNMKNPQIQKNLYGDIYKVYFKGFEPKQQDNFGLKNFQSKIVAKQVVVQTNYTPLNSAL